MSHHGPLERGVLAFVVIVFVLLAGAATVAALQASFAEGAKLPDLDNVERIVSLLGTPAGIIIYAYLRERSQGGEKPTKDD